MLRKAAGFTLTELIMAVAILGLAIAFAGPALQDVISGNKVVAKANDIRTALSFARTEAIRRGESITVAPVDGANWNQGMHLGLSSNFENNRLKMGSESLRVVTSSSSHFSMNVGSNRVEFNGRGFINTTLVFEVCDNTGSQLEEGRAIRVEVTGKVSVDKLNCKEDS